jgi:tetratricopeptide (TPR) repeat protein
VSQNANPKFHSRLSLALVEAGHLERDMPQYFDASRHCRPIGSRCRHEHTSLGTHERDLDPSFFANVGWVYMDTYLSFQPLELLLLWSSSMFEEALDRADGDYHAAQYGLGLARELMGRPEEALELYRRAKIQRPDSGTYVLAANR